MRFALEPKPNEPRGDIFLPTVGHALHFITTLARPTWSASTPRSRTRRWPGSRSTTASGRRCGPGKLFHVDLNGQDVGRYDQDFRFGAEDLKEAFLLVRLLERAGYAGPLHFDAHAYRNENAEGVWDFARRLHADLPLARRGRGPIRRAAGGPGGDGRRVRRRAGRVVGRLAGRRSRPRSSSSTRWPSAATTTSALDQLVVDVLLGSR